MIQAADTIIHGLSRLEVGTRAQYCPTTIACNTIVCCDRHNDRSRQENGHSRIAYCLFHSAQPTIRIVDESFAVKSLLLRVHGFAA
jgi:hypothetical protein